MRRHSDANGLDKLVLESPIKTRAPLSAKGRAGQALVEEVVLSVLDSVSCQRSMSSYGLFQTAGKDLDASTLEAVNTVRKGFADLGAINPELAYQITMDILGGIRS